MTQKYTITAAYFLSFTLLGLTIGVEGPALLTLASHTSSSISAISSTFFFGSLGYLLGSYFSGRLYDRIPGNRFMAMMLGVIAVFLVFVPVTRSLTTLVIVFTILGAAKGALDVGCNTLLLWLHHEKVGPYMNGLHAFFGVGAFIAPLIMARVLAVTGDIHWVYWSFALLALPILAMLWSLPSPLARAVPEEHQDAPFPILPVTIMVICFTIYVGMEIGYGNWIYAYAFKRGMGTEITANYLTSAFWGFFTLGRLIGIWISTRLRPLSILYLDFAGCIISLGLILLFRESTSILWAGTVLLGLSFASIFPTLLALAEERIHITGTITGWFLVGGSIGGMTIPVGIGIAFEKIGPTTMLDIVSLSTLLNLGFIILFTRLRLNPGGAGDKSLAES